VAPSRLIFNGYHAWKIVVPFPPLPQPREKREDRGKERKMNYPALTDGASRFIDTLTPGIPRVFHPASQRRSHPRASPLRSMGKVPPSPLGLEAQISLLVT